MGNEIKKGDWFKYKPDKDRDAYKVRYILNGFISDVECEDGETAACCFNVDDCEKLNDFEVLMILRERINKVRDEFGAEFSAVCHTPDCWVPVIKKGESTVFINEDWRN